MERRPNILFLMSDEHRADVAGFAGDKIVRTPVLDELAATGTVFTNAYTPAPVCVPGRQSMMAGQLPRTCGCESFWSDLTPGAMTFARRLSQYGYRTVASGKLHHHGTDQMQGWTKRIAPDADVADPFIEGLVADELPASSRAAEGIGKWSHDRELGRAGVGTGPYQEFDAVATSEAMRYIRQHFVDGFYDRPRDDRPLMLKVSLLQPHYPFFTDRERLEYYLNRVRPYEDETSDHPVLSQSQQRQPITATARDIRRATAAYYGMVETVDDHFGAVIRELERVGENLDEWIIVYTSDHGDMLGEHGIWEKTRFYEGSVRVPLIIRFPKRFSAGATVSQNVNLCDLFATLCELTGVPVPEGLDSRSLVPLLEAAQSGDDVREWNDESISQMGSDHLMIKRGPLKYQYYGEGIPEVLFDLDTDPGETRNALSDERFAKAVAEFRARRSELGYGPDADPDYVNAGYR